MLPGAGDALGGAQRLQLRQGEVLGEPAGQLHPVDRLGGLAAGELGVVGDVGGTGDVVLVTAYEMAVLGGHQVLLDDVGAHVQGELVGAEGVFGPVSAGSAVGDDGRVRQVAEGAGALPPGRLGGPRGLRQAEGESRGGGDGGTEQGAARGAAGGGLSGGGLRHGATPFPWVSRTCQSGSIVGARPLPAGDLGPNGGPTQVNTAYPVHQPDVRTAANREYRPHLRGSVPGDRPARRAGPRRPRVTAGVRADLPANPSHRRATCPASRS
ncbi:hypothetical protein SDIAM103S_00830 [Streptomyces diastaticus subsp. diastaticus]